MNQPISIQLVMPQEKAMCFSNAINLSLSGIHISQPDHEGESLVTLRFRENMERQWLKAGIRQGRSEVFDNLRHWDR